MLLFNTYFYFQFYLKKKVSFSLSCFVNLLYKKEGFQKMKSILTFKKWTKKMSKIGKRK